jgi:hypothetical protein
MRMTRILGRIAFAHRIHPGGLRLEFAGAARDAK